MIPKSSYYSLAMISSCVGDELVKHVRCPILQITLLTELS